MVKNKMGFGTGSYLTGIYQAQMTHTLYSNLKFISSFTDLSKSIKIPNYFSIHQQSLK